MSRREPLHPAVLQSALIPRKAALRRPLAWSFGGHVALVLGVVAYAWLFGGPRISLDQKPIQARLVRKGKPRDAKLLPRLEEPPPPPQKVEGPKEVAVPVPPPAKQAVPVPTPAAKAAPQPKAAAQAGAADGDRRKRLFGAFDKVARDRKPEEELEGDPEGSELGDSATGEGDPYLALISTQIQRHYDVSQTIPEQERLHLAAVVQVYVGRAGEVTKANLTKPSGNALFDSAVLLAVKRASPFSPPPDRLRETLQRTGQAFMFRP